MWHWLKKSDIYLYFVAVWLVTSTCDIFKLEMIFDFKNIWVLGMNATNNCKTTQSA